MSEFKLYRRTGLSEMRPYVSGEDLTNVSVSPEDDPETDFGMIARNPKNHADQWYVAHQYFEDNLEPADETPNIGHAQSGSAFTDEQRLQWRMEIIAGTPTTRACPWRTLPRSSLRRRMF